MNNLQHGKFVKTQQPCPDDKCGSSDACSIREDGSALCFSCEQNFKSYDKPYISVATKPALAIDKFLLKCKDCPNISPDI